MFITLISTTRGKDYVRLGFIDVNLSEFAGSREQSRRYLLQQSRVNATLKITIKADLIGGSPTYKVPVAKQEIDDGDFVMEESQTTTAQVIQAIRWRDLTTLPPSITTSRIEANKPINNIFKEVDPNLAELVQKLSDSTTELLTNV